MTKSIEERLDRLEGESYFQETLLQELNEALARQQREIDELERAVETMAAQTALLREALAVKPEQTLPPHYLPDVPR